MFNRLRSWIYYPQLFHFELQFFRPYWFIYRFWMLLRTRPGLWRFHWRSRWSNSRESFAFGRLMTQLIRVNLLNLSALFGVMLLVVWIIRHLPMPQELAPWRGTLVGGVPKPPNSEAPAVAFQVDPNTYVPLLVTIASIAGTFVGLYFTAISLVLSARYADAPDELRELISEEKVGNRYIQLVALLASFALLLLFIQSIGVNLGALPLFPLAVMILFVLLGFVPLGIRTFRFFDPTALAYYLTSDLQQAIQGATPDGFQWDVPAFQDYYRRQAERTLHLWEQIAYQTQHRATASSADVAQIGFTALHWLQFYVARKGAISAESLWFEGRFASKDWLTAGATELMTALVTDTPLHPEEKRDLFWFEERLILLLTQVLEHLIAKDEWMQVAQLTSSVAETAQVFGRCLAVEEGVILVQRVRSTLYPASQRKPTWPNMARAIFQLERNKQAEGKGIQSDVTTKDKALSEKQFLALLAALDSLGLAQIDLFLGVTHQIPTSAQEQIEVFLQKGNWRRPWTFYRRMLPRLVWDEWARLEKEIEFQLMVEGQVLAPPWQQKQYLARGYHRFWVDSIQKIIGSLEPTYLKPLERWQKNGCLPQMAQVATRGLEATHKILAHLESWEKLVEHLRSARCVDDGVWNSADWAGLAQRVEKIRHEIVVCYAKAGALFLIEPRNDHFPDYGGHAWSVACDESVNALVRGDEEAFGQLFPILLVCALSAFDRVIKEYNEENYPLLSNEARWAWAMDPLQNLLAISGLALIWSELDGKNFWTTARAHWDAELTRRSSSDHELGPDADKKLCRLLALATDDNVFSPKGAWNMLRMNWERHIEERVSALGLTGRYYDPSLRGLPPSPPHSSAFMRCWTRSGLDMFLSNHPEDYFAAYYLALHPASQDLNWPRSVNDLREEWEQYQKWETEAESKANGEDSEVEEENVKEGRSEGNDEESNEY